jgi:hypothetical protein
MGCRTGICRGEAREQLTEVCKDLSVQRRRVEVPSPSNPPAHSRCVVVGAVSQPVGQNEPAHDGDAHVLQMAQVLINFVEPPRRPASGTPRRRPEAEVPAVIEPWIVDTDLHPEFLSDLSGDAPLHDRWIYTRLGWPLVKTTTPEIVVSVRRFTTIVKPALRSPSPISTTGVSWRETPGKGEKYTVPQPLAATDR